MKHNAGTEDEQRGTTEDGQRKRQAGTEKEERRMDRRDRRDS